MAASMPILTTTLVFASLLLLSISEAKEILVGGSTDAWKISSSEFDSLNEWAQKSRFRIGDLLVWKYESGKDSVLEVTKVAYLTCNTTNPIKEYSDGNTKVELDRSGPFYFISGAEGHCQKGEKVIVVVLSQRHGRYTAGYSPAPAPSPSEVESPAVAPTSGANGVKDCGIVAILVALGAFYLGLF